MQSMSCAHKGAARDSLPVFFRLAPTISHDAPFAQPLLTTAVALYNLRLRIVRLDAVY